ITANVLMISYMMAMPFTGGSFNPVRSLASAIINSLLGFERPMQQVWIFLLAPTLGALFAVFLYKLINKEKNKKQSV
ncbi:MAG: aquaporin, partial [Lachnospiraceae bacterium]|nr:aquaporin [Lachnospiraceae bacterium]